MPSKHPGSLALDAKRILEGSWKHIQSGAGDRASGSVPERIRDAIEKSINSSVKTYRYVLPTQLLAKLANPSLDCRVVQQSAEMEGSYDARTLCRKVIVPFDRENHKVLGGSGDPYVNNPLRIPAITKQHRSAQMHPEGFDALCEVLEYVENDQARCKTVFDIVLAVIFERLQKVEIVYPVPNRSSLAQVASVVATFLSHRTGGVRMQAVAAGLFGTLGATLAIFDRVVSRHVNAADLRTGSAADLECLAEDGSVVMAVEVKDRELTVTDLQDKLESARQKGVQELLYLVRGMVRSSDAEKVKDISVRQFATGQNIYVCDFTQFLHSALIILREKGRRLMLQNIGVELDKRADLSDRQAWRDLLASL